VIVVVGGGVVVVGGVVEVGGDVVIGVLSFVISLYIVSTSPPDVSAMSVALLLGPRFP